MAFRTLHVRAINDMTPQNNPELVNAERSPLPKSDDVSVPMAYWLG